MKSLNKACAIYVLITPNQHTKMGFQSRLGIYIGYESLSIIKYLEPPMGDVFTARFANCHFNEKIFPTLGGTNEQQKKEIAWALSLNYLDLHLSTNELEIQKIIHLQKLANQLSDAFIDSTRVTKSHIPTVNTPI